MYELRRSELRGQCSDDPVLLSILEEDTVSYRMLVTDMPKLDHALSPLHVAASLGTNVFFVREILGKLVGPQRRELESSLLLIHEECEKVVGDVGTLRKGQSGRRAETALRSWYEQEAGQVFRRAQFKIEVNHLTFDCNLTIP